MPSGYSRNYAQFDSKSKLPTSFITDILGGIDIKEFVLHYGRALRTLWMYMLMKRPHEMKDYFGNYGLETWLGLFDNQVLFPEVEIVSTNPMEDKLRKYLNKKARISIREEVEWNVIEHHGDEEPRLDEISDREEIDEYSNDAQESEIKLSYSYVQSKLKSILPELKEFEFTLKLLNFIYKNMDNKTIDDETLPLKTSEDAFEHIIRAISQKKIDDWIKREKYKPFKLLDMKERLIPYLDGFLSVDKNNCFDIKLKCIIWNGRKDKFPEDKTSYKSIYKAKRPQSDYFNDESFDPNEGQFYNLLEHATDYYEVCTSFIRNEIPLDELYKKLSRIQSSIESTMASYREEYWKKHFEDCMTPMGTYECLVSMCSKVRGLIEFIRM